jgi:RNA 3'-phosphate cyclase
MTIEIDCSFGEGGGSIVRILIALSAALNIPLILNNIRSNRPNPGLRIQHIEAIRAIEQLSGCRANNLTLGTTNLSFKKEHDEFNNASVNISTAGNVSLVVQAVLYYSLTQRRNLQLTILGGATHGKWAPSIEYITNITHYFLKMMDKNVETEIDRYGFFPKGGAMCSFFFKNHEDLLPLNLTEKGSIEEIEIFSTVSSDLSSRKVAERQVNSFLENINPNVDVRKNLLYVNSICPGSGLTVINKYSSGSRMGFFISGDKKISAEKVGQLCSVLWKKNMQTSAAIDTFAADQLIVPMALTSGESKITIPEISNHTKTNLKLIQHFLKVKIETIRENNYYKIIINNEK